MKQDRFLIGILIALAVLVAGSIGLFFLRGASQDYGPEDTPEGVIRNYILALEKDDYQRAYSYLARGEGKPGFATFRSFFTSGDYRFATVGVQIGASDRLDEEAYVQLTLIHTARGPFDNGWNEQAAAVLILGEGGWRIRQMPYPYWGFDWYSSAGGD